MSIVHSNSYYVPHIISSLSGTSIHSQHSPWRTRLEYLCPQESLETHIGLDETSLDITVISILCKTNRLCQTNAIHKYQRKKKYLHILNTLSLRIRIIQRILKNTLSEFYFLFWEDNIEKKKLTTVIRKKL